MWSKLSLRKRRTSTEEKAPAVPATTTTTTGASSASLPSLTDRLLLYGRIEATVEQQCEEYQRLLDPRSMNRLSNMMFASKRVPITEVGIRKRQLDYLELEFLPTVSAALLLELFHLESKESCFESSSSQQKSIQEPVACIALLVSNMVLVSKGNYDARDRSILKAVCVQLLTEMPPPPSSDASSGNDSFSPTLYLLTPKKKKKEKADKDTPLELSIQNPTISPRQRAAQHFESIEKAVATDILSVLLQRQTLSSENQSNKKTWKHAAWRGLQITTVGVVVGSLFAVTGGLAAPGLVAAITALGVHSSVVFATLTTTTALASMFGVVGGGLGAYKMSKRVQGLSEWRIRKETSTSAAGAAAASSSDASSSANGVVALKGLHATVGVSGWLMSESDFQTPFGVQANDPCMPNRTVALQRFWAVHKPEMLPTAKEVIKERSNNSNSKKNELDEYWKELEQEYGRNPDQLLPMDPSSSSSATSLSDTLQKSIYDLLVNHCLTEQAAERLKKLWETSTMLVQMQAKNQEVLGTATGKEEETDREELISTADEGLSSVSNENETTELDAVRDRDDKTTVDKVEMDSSFAPAEEDAGAKDSSHSASDSDETAESISEDSTEDHTQVIWDWQAAYSGELYTVTWETGFLLKLCRVATVLFLELSDQLSKQILTQSLVGATLSLPSALLTCSGVIDDPYQIIALRSKKAGIELAYCLLTSDEHRPISLVGFSFGARMIFDCLLELARHQKIWQEQQKHLDDASEQSATTTTQKKNAPDHINYIREPASIVEDVVLMGMPRTIDVEEWIQCREIVAGRLVNCFSRRDWIVSYMINVRCGGGIRKTCGTHPIKNLEGVENYEVSDLAPTHGRYVVNVPQILQRVGYSQPRDFTL